MHYTGKVIHKETGKPLQGVPVCDGLNTVLTDVNGCYELPGWERTRMVWVGMLTRGHDDWYYYTDGKAGRYDFTLTPADYETLEFLQTSDTEISADKDVEWVSFIRENVRKETAFIIHTGDITRREGVELHKEVMNNESMGCPVRYVIGNHDYALETDPTVDHGEQALEESSGPVWNSFDCGGVHCVVLSFGRGSRGDMATGYKKADQWTWLKNDLETLAVGKPVIAFQHGPCPDPYEFVVGEGLDLKQYNLLAWVFGHEHCNMHHIRNGVHMICTNRPHTGGIDSSPACIRRIMVKDGKLEDEMIYRRFPNAPADKVVWQTKCPGGVLYCEPVLCGENLYVGTMSDDQPGTAGLSCIHAGTGELKWFVPAQGNGVVNNFALDEERLYMQDTMGFVYCLNAETGEIIWEKELYLGLASKTKMPAVVAGELLLVGASMKVFALNKYTGEELWINTEMNKGDQTGARTVYVQQHNYALHSSQWGTLICIDLKTGKALWQINTGNLWYRCNTPCVDGDVVYACGGGALVKLNIHTGEVLQEIDVGDGLEALGIPEDALSGNVNVCGAPTLDGDTLYCPTSRAGVVAVDKNTLTVLRRFGTGTACLLTAPYVKQGVQMVESSPVICGDSLIFTAMDGKVYFYNKHTKELLKTVNMPAPTLVKPIVTDNSVYTVDFDGNACKFAL